VSRACIGSDVLRAYRCQKQNLSACVVDDAQDTERHFSIDSLRQLFKFNENTPCDTHDTFKCKRCKDGRQVIKAPALLYGDASSWNHYPNKDLGKLHDDLLRAELGLPEVSFVFQFVSEITTRTELIAIPGTSRIDCHSVSRSSLFTAGIV
jgi:hypothetical protein